MLITAHGKRECKLNRGLFHLFSTTYPQVNWLISKKRQRNFTISSTCLQQNLQICTLSTVKLSNFWHEVRFSGRKINNERRTWTITTSCRHSTVTTSPTTCKVSLNCQKSVYIIPIQYGNGIMLTILSRSCKRNNFLEPRGNSKLYNRRSGIIIWKVPAVTVPSLDAGFPIRFPKKTQWRLAPSDGNQIDKVIKRKGP